MQRVFNAQYENILFEVAILDHKTLATADPCVIVFTCDLYLKIFFNDFQNSLGRTLHKKEESKFFVSWSGKCM